MLKASMADFHTEVLQLPLLKIRDGKAKFATVAKMNLQ
jgi:hypothetical protein